MAEAHTSWWRRLGALSGATLAILIAVLVAIAAADRAHLTVDLSADHRFTIHPRLTALVEAQREPVTITGFWGVDGQDALAAIDAVGASIGRISPLVTWQRLDPELQKPLVAAFAEAHGDVQPGTIAVTRGNRLYRIDLTPGIRFTLQREIGAALVSVADADPPPAVLLQGHGELRAQGGAEHSGDLLARTLAQAGFTLQTHDATTTVAPPPHALVVVAGPLGALGERDLHLLDQHLRDGGGLLMLTDDRTPPDVRRWLRLHGVCLGGRPATPDPRAAELPTPEVILSMTRHETGQDVRFPYQNLLLRGAQFHPGHPISSLTGAEDREVQFPWCTPVWLIDPALLNDPAQTHALQAAYHDVGTAPFSGVVLAGTIPGDAWTKPRAAPLVEPTDLAQAPPQPVAVAIEYAPHATSVRAGVGGRLIVWGSRQAASDALLAQGRFANDAFLRRSAHWLTHRSPPTDIPPAESTAFQVQASDTLLTALTAFLLTILPCLCLGGAMLTWWDRR